MDPGSDWKQHLKQQIYINNYNAMRDHYQFNLQERFSIESVVEKASLIFSASTIVSQVFEDPLPDYSNHNENSFYIPVNHNVDLINEVDFTLPFLQKMNPNAKQLVLKDFQRALKDRLAKKQKQLNWQCILRKFLCPLDQISKISLYMELLRNGTQHLQTYRINLADQMSSYLFLEHISKSKRYVRGHGPQFISVSDRDDNNNQHVKQNKDLCKICCLYGCVFHKNNQQQDNSKQQVNFEERNTKIIKSYLCFYKQLTKIQNEDYSSQFTCSNRCFKKLNLATYQVLLESYSETSVDQNRMIEMGRQMYLFQPCKISKMTQISCRQVFMYLVINYPLPKMCNTLGLSEVDYLKQKSKPKVSHKRKRCKCRKGDCRSRNCRCYRNGKQCESICRNCYKSPNHKFKCNNKAINMERSKFVRVGKRNNNQLTLYTMRSLKKGDLIFWLSGERLTRPLDEIRHLLAEQPEKPQCKYVHDLISTLRIGSKYRFLLHSNSLVGNIEIVSKQVNNQRYWFFYAKQRIKQFDELFYPCHCKSLSFPRDQHF